MSIALRRALPWTIGAMIVCGAAFPVHTQQRRTWQLLIVVDGLRPDYITPDVMPRLRAIGQRGVFFNAHHSIFPTMTRVNASSMSTGAYPETHGLLGNTVYSPKVSATKGVSTSNATELDAMENAEGRLLTAPTLGESLQRGGRRLLVFSAGSPGSAMLLNHPLYDGEVINPEYCRPADVCARVTAAFGPGPAEVVPDNPRNQWAVDALLTFGLNSDVTAFWFGDPDATAHQKGIGSEMTIQALKYVDGQIGRIEDALRAQGLFDRTNIIVVSDHGFSTATGELRLASLVAPFARAMPDGTPDLVVTEGAINFRGAPDPARVAAVVADLQTRPEVGAIFTRPASEGSMQGVVSGTLSFNVPRWNHARSGDILVSANWNADKNEAGVPGKMTQTGVAGHGTTSPYEIHNTFLAAGPDFREHVISDAPTANVDIAPTILKLLGLPIPASMTGRVVEEAFRTGPAPAFLRVAQTIETARTADGRYRLDAHISAVAGHRYFDFTEVRRSGR
jgi:predicted AlkP superfamily pyrophosphatase or phosphodiesterase